MIGGAFVAGLRRGGQRIVHGELRASAKIARSTRVVVGASSARWKCVTRLAGVKCTRPSAVSADGLTVAALATHIAAADEHAASSTGASRAARAEHRASLPREAQRAQRRHVRTLVRRQHRLRIAARRERAHLGESLQCGLARIGDLARVALGGEVAVREARRSCASGPGCRRS